MEQHNRKLRLSSKSPRRNPSGIATDSHIVQVHSPPAKISKRTLRIQRGNRLPVVPDHAVGHWREVNQLRGGGVELEIRSSHSIHGTERGHKVITGVGRDLDCDTCAGHVIREGGGHKRRDGFARFGFECNCGERERAECDDGMHGYWCVVGLERDGPAMFFDVDLCRLT